MSGDAVFGDGGASSPEAATLRRIADTLGLPVAALSAPREPRILHAAMSGARWLLTRNTHGTVIVRHLAGPAADRCVSETSPLDFLARDPGSPQQRALAALVTELLANYVEV